MRWPPSELSWATSAQVSAHMCFFPGSMVSVHSSSDQQRDSPQVQSPDLSALVSHHATLALNRLAESPAFSGTFASSSLIRSRWGASRGSRSGLAYAVTCGIFSGSRSAARRNFSCSNRSALSARRCSLASRLPPMRVTENRNTRPLRPWRLRHQIALLLRYHPLPQARGARYESGCSTRSRT